MRKIVRIDNADENSRIEQLSKAAGLRITFQYNAPHTPQQNGLAEPRFAMLCGIVRSIFNAVFFGKNYVMGCVMSVIGLLHYSIIWIVTTCKRTQGIYYPIKSRALSLSTSINLEKSILRPQVLKSKSSCKIEDKFAFIWVMLMILQEKPRFLKPEPLQVINSCDYRFLDNP